MSVIAELATDERAIVVAIVLARLLVPLLIPRIPLVILVCLVLDAADNSLLARFTEVDLGPGGPYQSFDKALDIYYLSIAYLATMRNWTSVPALRVAQFLFYYGLAALALFVVRPRIPAPDWGFRLAAEPLPGQADAVTRDARRRRKGQVHWNELIEKAGLLALLSVIFATILSDVTLTGLEVAVAAVAVVCANTAYEARHAPPPAPSGLRVAVP